MMATKPNFDNEDVAVFENENDDVVVSATNVSKKFCKNLRRSMSHGIADLSKNLIGIKPDSTGLGKDEFWAIDDISFELKKGEVIGIIGLNGSGKSTLLRVLAGIFPLDKGEVKIAGRVGALIAVGAGFHPHMTGRENIYLNGSILGMSRKMIHSNIQEIIDFAGIKDFIDAPVSTYSSGMRVRLGFSIAAYMEPDVMLIDEVLAVGDFSFRQKCAEKINEIRRKTAVILVSHNMRDILMLCSKAIVLNKGKVAFQGASENAVDFYLDMADTEKSVGLERKKTNVIGDHQFQFQNTIYGELFQNNEKISNIRHQWVSESGNPVMAVEHRASIILEFSFKLLKPVSNLIIGVPIFSRGDMITAANTDAQRVKITVNKGGYVKGTLEIPDLLLNPGKYQSVFVVMDSNEYLCRDFIGEFHVNGMPFYFGVLTLKQNWQFES